MPLEAVVPSPIANGISDRQTETSIIHPRDLPTIIFTSSQKIGVGLLHSEKNCLNFVNTASFA